MKETQTISVRVPIKIFEKVRKEAEEGYRSISQQIVLYLDKAINAEMQEQETKKAEPVGAEK